MSSNKVINNNNNTNTPIVYRSKLFKNSEQQDKLFKNSEQQDNKSQIQTENKTQNKSQYKTFCKVCQDAGKLLSEYTNHNVRDKTGRTTCPTLLAQECRNCFKNGHTVKYCPLIKAKSEPIVKPVAKAVVKAPVMPKNVFMVFDNDSDSEEEPVQDTAFPTLVSVIAPALNQKPVLNYGKIIDQVNDPATYAKAKEEELREKAKKYAEEQEAKRQKDLIEWAKAKAAKEAELKAIDERIKARAGKKFSWADAESDSEGDEEEDEVVDNSAW
jgi:hypothetical protein